VSHLRALWAFLCQPTPNTVKADPLKAEENDTLVQSCKHDGGSMQRILAHSLCPTVTADIRTMTADALPFTSGFHFPACARGPTPENRHFGHLRKPSLCSTLTDQNPLTTLSIITDQHPPTTLTNSDTKLYDASSTRKRAIKPVLDKQNRIIGASEPRKWM
jgi:hypothetical protein